MRIDPAHRQGATRHRTAPRAVTALTAALLLAGCSAGAIAPATDPAATGSPAPSIAATSTVTAAATASTPAPTASSPIASPAATPAASAEASAFPATVTDDEGTAVTIDAPPQRIVSLAPASTETLFALGVGQRVIAGSASDDYPPAAIPLPDVATFEGVQVEKVVALKPDLVVAAGDLGQSEPAHKLRSLGIRSVVLGSKDLASIVSDIKLLGALTGTATAAQRITDRILSRIDQVKAAAATGPRPRVFYELGFTPPKGPLYGLTDGSFTAELVRIAGGDPITTGSASNAEMPVERLVKADPEVIILGDASYPGGPKPDEVPNRPGGWSGMAAVRSRAVRVVDDVIVTRPGPRLGDGVAALARAIRPGIVLPSAAP